MYLAEDRKWHAMVNKSEALNIKNNSILVVKNLEYIEYDARDADNRS